jgi:hypothetical protein
MEFLAELPVRLHELGVAGPQLQRPSQNADSSEEAVKLWEVGEPGSRL